MPPEDVLKAFRSLGFRDDQFGNFLVFILLVSDAGELDPEDDPKRPRRQPAVQPALLPDIAPVVVDFEPYDPARRASQHDDEDRLVNDVLVANLERGIANMRRKHKFLMRVPQLRKRSLPERLAVLYAAYKSEKFVKRQPRKERR